MMDSYYARSISSGMHSVLCHRSGQSRIVAAKRIPDRRESHPASTPARPTPLSDAERSTLAEITKRLGRKALQEIARVAKPDTVVPENPIGVETVEGRSAASVGFFGHVWDAAVVSQVILRVFSQDEHGQSSLGRAARSRGTLEARVRAVRIDGCEVHGRSSETGGLHHRYERIAA
jgi:hypothetical protein